jgi:hypothetical protein
MEEKTILTVKTGPMQMQDDRFKINFEKSEGRKNDDSSSGN